jgi:hypothetical protein
MDRGAFQRWLDAYTEAWNSYDPDKIGALFAADIAYRYRPLDEPVVGRQAVVADWLAERDNPGTYQAQYEPLAIDGEVHVARGISRYLGAEGQVSDEYSNIFVCHFDTAGRCTSFTEYFTRSRQFEPRVDGSQG